MECHVIGYQGDRKSRDALQIGCFNHVTWRTALTATYWVMRRVALFFSSLSGVCCVCMCFRCSSVCAGRATGWKGELFLCQASIKFSIFSANGYQ